MRARAISVAVMSVLFAGLAYLELSPHEELFPQPLPPFLPAVASCAQPMQGMRRIGERTGFEDTGFRFDVPIEDFTIWQGCSDTPPVICGFDIKPKNSAAHLSVSWGESTTEGRPPDPILDSSDPDSSAFAATRRVLDDKGKRIGQESWGYWGQGERWRRVHLVGRVQASYGSKNEGEVRSNGFVHEREAARFDQIINSACRLSSPDE